MSRLSGVWSVVVAGVFLSHALPVVAQEAPCATSTARWRQRAGRASTSPSAIPGRASAPLEVRARRSDWTVRAPGWSGSPAPETVTSARARRFLAGDAGNGGLPVTAAVGFEAAAASAAPADGELRHGTLQARVDLSHEELLAGPTGLRVTFAVELPGQAPFERSDVVEDQQLAGLEAWTYTVPVALPPQAGKVAVLVEELTTGAWGGALAAQVTGPLPEVPADATPRRWRAAAVPVPVRRAGSSRATTCRWTCCRTPRSWCWCHQRRKCWPAAPASRRWSPGRTSSGWSSSSMAKRWPPFARRRSRRGSTSAGCRGPAPSRRWPSTPGARSWGATRWWSTRAPAAASGCA